MNPEQLQEKYLLGDFKLKGEFLDGAGKREEVLTRAERYAGWTLPTIFPDNPLNEYDEMQNDFQSVGAAAVTNLSNKMMMALFPPSRPFFRTELTDEQEAEVLATGITPAELDAALSKAEREATKALTRKNSRVVLTDAMKSIIITGNALLYVPVEDNMQNYTIRDYIIVRDLRGSIVKIIIRETKAVVGLSDELASLVMSQGYSEKDEVSMYTCILRTGEDKFIVWQELEDVCYCHKRIGVYNSKTLPWIPLVWNLARNKDYGTGLVEEYAGDFHVLSTLAEATLDFTTVVTDVKNLVDPTSSVDITKLVETPSGGYVHGREGDVFSYSADVTDATNFLNQQFDKVERRIAAAFLLNTLVTRDAERVTAEEIRMQQQELATSFGGVYARQATELQTPLAQRFMKEVNSIFDEVEPVITTGLESLSRNSELDQWRYFFQDLIALAEVPDKVSVRIDYGNLIATLGAGHGVDYKKVLKSEEDVKKAMDAQAKANAQAQGQEAGAVAQAQADAEPPQQ